MLRERCVGCHRLYPPGSMTAEMWKVQVTRMRAEFARRGLPWLRPDEEAVLLEYLGARTLVLTGASTHQCVLFTANDAYVRDYRLWIPSDCVASKTRAQTRLASRYFRSGRGGTGIPSWVIPGTRNGDCTIGGIDPPAVSTVPERNTFTSPRPSPGGRFRHAVPAST